jgi:putative endonuclease
MAFGSTIEVERLEQTKYVEGIKLAYMPYFLYILRTSSNTLYIGQTRNLEKRLKEHQAKSGKSAKYVRYFDSVKLIYSEQYLTRKEAMQREVMLKKWSKAKKEALIRGDMIA